LLYISPQSTDLTTSFFRAEPEAREFNDKREFDEELSEREFDWVMEREIDGDELFSRDVDFGLFERVTPKPFFDRTKKWVEQPDEGQEEVSL